MEDAHQCPIIIEGPEQSLVDPALADAGLPPAVGVQSFQVFRASKAVPEITDRPRMDVSPSRRYRLLARAALRRLEQLRAG